MLRISAPRIHPRTPYWVATLLFVLTLSGLLATPVCAQQITVTFSKGAPGDPFSQPTYIVFDKQGNLFVSDTSHHRVQRIDKQTGAVTTVVGTGTSGYAGDGGPAIQAQIDCPLGLAFDGSGNLYVADHCRNVVRKIVPGADSVITGASDEIITSFAGNGTVASCDLARGAASQTPISAPGVLATDQGGNLFMIAGQIPNGSCFQLVQRVDTSGFLTTTEIAGPSPTNTSMAFDASGNLFVWVFQSNLQKCTPAALTQSADPVLNNPGCGDAAHSPDIPMNGNFDPVAMAFDQAGSLYFSNGGAATVCEDGCSDAIFKLTPVSGGIGLNSTWSIYAGTQDQGYSGDGGAPLNATFHNAIGLAFNGAGNLFVGDSGNNVIRAILNCAPIAAGSGISVNPLDQDGTSRSDIGLTFDNVASAGCTAVVTGQNAPALPSGLQLAGSPAVFYDIVSSAQFTGNAQVCLIVNPLPASAKLLHFNQATQTWDDVTQSVDQSTGKICGLVSSLSPFAVVQEGAAPPVLTAHPANPTNQATASFSFTDSDPTVTAFACTLDGTVSSCASGVSYSGLSDGSHTFSVVGQTAGGIASSPVSYTWVVDTVAPPVPLINSHPNDPSNSASASFAFSDTEANVSFTCSLDGVPAPCISPAAYSGLAAGSHTFSVSATDAAGNASAAATFSWTAQFTPPPAPQITSAPASLSNQNPPAFTFTDAQAGVTFQCQIDGGVFQPCVSGVSYTGLLDGSHIFTVRAVDALAGAGPSATFSWMMDITPPQAPQLSSTPANPSGTTQASFGFVDGSSDVVSYLCALDGSSFTPCASGVSFTVAQGNHTFVVEAKDGAGNISPTTTFNWTVDTTTPQVGFFNVPAKVDRHSVATFAFAAQFATVSFECNLDGVAFVACSSPDNFVVPDGPHTFQVRATSAAGVTGPVVSYAWVVDTVPPPMPSVSGPPAQGQTRVVTFTFSDSESGVSFLCGFNNAGAAPCTSPRSISTFVLDKEQSFQVYAMDAAGNVSAPANYPWIVYTVPPAAPTLTAFPANSLGPPPSGTNAFTNQTSATFAWTDTALDIASYQCRLDSQIFTPCSVPASYSNLAEGGHTFSVQAVDIFGNLSQITTFSWIVDVTPPAVPVFDYVTPSPTGGTPTRRNAPDVFVFHSTDQYGIFEYLCSLDGSSFSPCNNSNTQYLTPEGFHTLLVQAVDNAGNVSAAPPYTWLVDLHPPVVTPPADLVVVAKPDGTLDSVETALLYPFSIGASATDNFTAAPTLLGFTFESSTSMIQASGTNPTFPCPKDPLNLPRALGLFLPALPVGDNCILFDFEDAASNIGHGFAHVRVVPGTPTDPASGNTVVPPDPRQAPTPAGQPASNVTVTFTGGVTGSGYTGVDITTTGPALPAGFKLGNPPQYYDIVTSAPYTAPVTVCIAASPLPAGSALLHYDKQTQQWEDLTIQPVPVNGPICAQVNSLSPFAVVQPLNNPPTANAGANQTVEATGPSGAAVTLSGSGSDPDNDPLTFTWSENGSALGTGATITVTLPIGVHSITLTADDGRGGTGTSTSVIVVQDTTPPVFTPPASQTLEATSPVGAIALFSATATDIVDGPRPVLCSPASGATFPPGTTTVACTSTDLHGNTSSGSFSITVRDITPPVVTPPVSITVPATEAGGARGSAWPALAAFLAGATAVDVVDPAPQQLSPQAGGVNVDKNALFPYGTTTVTFRFRDAHGNLGMSNATVTVFLGTSKITSQLVAQGRNSDGTLFVDIKLANTGTGNARHLRVDLILAVPASGDGKIRVVSPAIPMIVGTGNLDAGSSQTVRVVLQAASTIKQFVLAEAGNFTNVKGTLDLFAAEQKVTP